MKKFISNILRFSSIGLIPLLILLTAYLVLDPFKVINSYDTFYDTKAKGWVGTNRDYVTTTTFVNNRKRSNIYYNSYIFGNSRSLFYQISDWEKHLPRNSKCFHFDAFGETLWAINKKIEFIDNQGLGMEHVLLILDNGTLAQDKPKEGHLSMITPALVNNSNIVDFHLTSFKAFLSVKFLYAYIDFVLSGQVKPYMKKKFLLEDTPKNYDRATNEIRYDIFEDMIEKNQYYTPERVAIFYKRDSVQKYASVVIGENQKALLSNINNIFKKQNTKFKIIISPLYDQVKFNEIDLDFLNYLFGADNVYDFAGINAITSNYHNYYESSHFRPHIAREIMNEIYKND